MRAYDGQLAIYFSGDELPRGCFVIGTAVTEAVEDAEIRSSLADRLPYARCRFRSPFPAWRVRGAS